MVVACLQTLPVDLDGGSCAVVDGAALPKWFVWTVSTSVVLSLAWIVGLVAVQHLPKSEMPVSISVSPETAASMAIYAGVLNSMLGSFLSASGYCCQKWAHNRVQANPALGTASQQRVFITGLFLLAVGTISAVLNLGILGQAVQAPFAALTLIYSALLGHFVLQEPFVLYDAFSSVLIVLGVAVDVFAAQLSTVPQQSYTLKTLAALLFRDSIFPIGYTVVALSYTMIMLHQVHNKNLHHRALGLLAFSSCAGIMAGFTSLATKSAVEVSKSALKHHTWDVLNPFFLLILAAIPSALIPQLFFLNKGLEYFGTLKFIPLYQAFIILGNMVCGMIFYNEMASYTRASLLVFLGGILVTLSGVCLLLAKADTTAGPQPKTPAAVDAAEQAKAQAYLATDFAFEDMRFACDNLCTLRDFDECKRTVVQLLQSATESVYYSTFLCDFSQVLCVDPKGERHTFLSLVDAAVKRGVQVHILYNPVADYGTESAAELRRVLPRGVMLSCSVSDLGPSTLTRCLSNNSKYAFHHQKYLCIDGRRIMVTGCDVNAEREGWLHTNCMGYYWHELGVVSSCTPEMFAWIQKNHAPTTKKRHYDQFVDAAPFPLVSGGWAEENAMVNMIRHARHSIQLENQILISGGSVQHNRICDAIVTRICEAHRANEPFHVLLLTNAAQQDEPSKVTRLYCSLSVQWSLEQLENRAEDNGMTVHELQRYLIVARMESSGILIKVHSNILIVDGWFALRSSSNLADRSLSGRPTDTELGLLFAGEQVRQLQQDLFNMYFSTLGEQYSMERVFEHIYYARPGCCLVPMEKKDWSPVFTWFLMNAFIFCSEGATGGRRKVTFATSLVSTAGGGGCPTSSPAPA